MEQGQNSRFYRFMERTAMLIELNICMVLLSLRGLFIFGIFPAIFAAAEYLNDVADGKEGKMFKEMTRYYKKNFRIGNLLMIIVVPTAALVLYLIYGKELNTIMYLIIFTWVILVQVLCWYLPVINTLYPEFPVKKKLVFSMVASCDRWLYTILFLATNLVWLYAVFLMPQLFMFFVFSFPVWFAGVCIRKALNIERKEDEDDWTIEQEDAGRSE